MFAASAAIATVHHARDAAAFARHARQAHEVGRARARENPPARARTAGARRGQGRAAAVARSSTCSGRSSSFNLTKWLAQEAAREKLVQAGYRGHAPYVAFLFFRHGDAGRAVPVCGCSTSSSCSSWTSRRSVKIGMCLAAAYGGMQAAVRVPQEPHRQAPAVDQARLPGRARPAADLRRVRHVDRSGVQARSARRSARSRSRWPRS